MLTVHQFACLSDNYGFLARDSATGKTAAIDTPDADAILREMRGLGWSLDLILNTHWHPDHAGGNAALQAATGAAIVGPAEVVRLGAAPDHVVGAGEQVLLGETRFEVIDVGGHTLGHIAYWDAADQIAFVGDAIFAMGCGRMFEGDPEQFWASLSRLAALPDEAVLYCAHEYTAANARFALAMDSNPAVAARAAQVFDQRERGEPTVPTTVAQEKATNPFLRAPVLIPGLAPAQAFARMRSAKDDFRG